MSKDFKPLEIAADAAKQIIALSTGALGLTLTYFKDFESGTITPSLRFAWIAFGLAAAFGVWTMLAITGSATSGGGAYGPNVRTPAVVMVLCFTAGIACTIASVW